MPETLRISSRDRGWRYGDGCFRTIRVVNGRPVIWEAHQACLKRDANRLGIALPSDWQSSIQSAAEGAAHSFSDAILRVVLTRGDGDRGYKPDRRSQGRIYSEVSEARTVTPIKRCQIQLCDLRLAWQPRLAGIKHLNRLEQVIASAEVRSVTNNANGCLNEGILLDQGGNVIGGTRTNLFLVAKGQIKTPRLHRCGIAGATRHWLLQMAAEKTGSEIKEVDIKLSDLRSADEIFLSNAVLGICPVTDWGGKSWDSAAISRQFQELFQLECE